MTRTGARSVAPVLLTCLLALVLAAGLVAPASATNVRVRHTLFGMHDSTYQSLPRLQEGSVRLWDVGVQWQQIETKPGRYSWGRLDDLVRHAQAARAQVTMVVAMTPSFYSADPTKPPGDLQHYRDFVHALMARYRDFHGTRGIAAYQVWNEANISNSWTGTPHQMALLTRAMDQVRDQVDPGATVVAPALVTRLSYQLAWLKRYDEQRVGGLPVWRYFDVVSLNLYPLATYGGRAAGPEESMTLLAQARSIMRGAGFPASLPIWNTEVNYGLQSAARAGHHANPISAARQASYVMRTYLLNAAAGVGRAFWYRYDFGRLPASVGGGTLGNTLLSDPGDKFTVTPAGHAYLRVQSWMHGTLRGTRGHRPCRHDAHGTYTCVVHDASGTRRIYWNPRHRVRVRLAAGARHAERVLGRTIAVRGGSRLNVDYRPVLVTR